MSKHEKYNKEVDTLHKDLSRKEEMIKRLIDDQDNLKRVVENLKKDNNSLKSSIKSTQDEIRQYKDKVTELENEKIVNTCI